MDSQQERTRFSFFGSKRIQTRRISEIIAGIKLLKEMIGERQKGYLVLKHLKVTSTACPGKFGQVRLDRYVTA